MAERRKKLGMHAGYDIDGKPIKVGGLRDTKHPAPKSGPRVYTQSAGPAGYKPRTRTAPATPAAGLGGKVSQSAGPARSKPMTKVNAGAGRSKGRVRVDGRSYSSEGGGRAYQDKRDKPGAMSSSVRAERKVRQLPSWNEDAYRETAARGPKGGVKVPTKDANPRAGRYGSESAALLRDKYNTLEGMKHGGKKKTGAKPSVVSKIVKKKGK